MTDFLDEKRREITDRLKELKPLVDEYSRLEAAASALGGRRRIVDFSRGRRSRSSSPWTGTSARLGQPHQQSRRDQRAHRRRHHPAKAGAKNQVAQRKRKKVGRPAGPAKQRSPRRETGRQGAGRRKGSGTRAAEALCVRAGAARHHDPRAGGQDGHQAELPVPRAARARAGREGEKKGRGWHPKGWPRSETILRSCQGGTKGGAVNSTAPPFFL